MIEMNENVTREMNKYLDGITIEEIFALLSLQKKTFHFQVAFTRDQLRQEVDVLDLSVRAYHCLKRSGYNTLNDLVEGIYTKEGESSKRQLRKIRNLGANSADEILIKLMNYQFMSLSDSGRQDYMNKLLNLNLEKES